MKRKSKKIVFAICTVLLVVLLAVMYFVSVEKEYGEYLLLNTPIGELYYTERWENYIVVDEFALTDGYTANISANIDKNNVLLYTLYIGVQTENGFLIGTVDNADVRVDVPNVELDSGWTRKNINLVNTMQEDLGCILNQIMGMDSFRATGTYDSVDAESVGKFLLLSAPIGEIYFSEQWRDGVVVDEVSEDDVYTAIISTLIKGKAVKLCMVHVGGESQQDNLIGYVNNTAVSINMPEIVPENDWTDVEMNTIYMMQEDLNSIVTQVMNMDSFHEEFFSDDYDDASFDDYLLLSLPIGELYFSKQWENAIIAEEIPASEGYVAVISVQTDSGTVKVYELYIGTQTDNGYLLGNVDGMEIHMNELDIALDSGWAKADIDTVYCIQEALESIADQIAAMDGFERT